MMMTTIILTEENNFFLVFFRLFIPIVVTRIVPKKSNTEILFISLSILNSLTQCLSLFVFFPSSSSSFSFIRCRLFSSSIYPSFPSSYKTQKKNNTTNQPNKQTKHTHFYHHSQQQQQHRIRMYIYMNPEQRIINSFFLYRIRMQKYYETNKQKKYSNYSFNSLYYISTTTKITRGYLYCDFHFILRAEQNRRHTEYSVYGPCIFYPKSLPSVCVCLYIRQMLFVRVCQCNSLHAMTINEN